MRSNGYVKRWFSLFGRECHYCGQRMLTKRQAGPKGSPALATVDHIIPKSRGGKGKWDDIQVICRRCNNDKASLTHYEYLHALEGRVRFEFTEHATQSTMRQVHARLYRAA